MGPDEVFTSFGPENFSDNIEFYDIISLQMPKDIRPRTQKPAMDALMCLKPHLTEALHDSNHSLYHHAKNSPDWDFVAARQEVAAQIQPFIDLFEKDNGIMVSLNYFEILN